MLHHHARRHVGGRAVGADRQSLAFQIANGLVLRPGNQQMGRAVHETGNDFHRHAAQRARTTEAKTMV